MENADPFALFKRMQRENWADFAINEPFTTPPAADLVRFASVRPGEMILDVGCGSGVVAITAARVGASSKGLDLTPALLERARDNAIVAHVDVEFLEGDAEALPFASASFDVVLSQFGHMFAPRPEVATAEMLRVLKPGGRIAFSTWPPETGMGRLFSLLGTHMPRPAVDAPEAASPWEWGDPSVVCRRLGGAVTNIEFRRAIARSPALSPGHALRFMETSFGPLTKLLSALQGQPEKVALLRGEILAAIEETHFDNYLHRDFLMTRALKN